MPPSKGTKLPGRPPIPRAVKEAQGTLNGTRERRVQERVQAGVMSTEFVSVPPPPEDWEEYEKNAWNELKAQVDAIGTYSKSDATAFMMLAALWAKFQMSRADGVFDTDDGGQRRVIKSSTLAMLASKITMGLTHFGLTPASRTRVPSSTQQAQAKLADLDEFKAPVLKLA